MERHLDQPIMSYRERIFVGHGILYREFSLYPDHILNRWHSGMRRGEARIPLAEVLPEPDRVWRKHQSFRMGMIMLIAGLGGAILVWLDRDLAHKYVVIEHIWRIHIEVFMAAAIGLGILCMYIYRRPIETACFKNRNLQVVLGINRAGPEKARFDEFVAKVQEQVRKCGPGTLPQAKEPSP